MLSAISKETLHDIFILISLRSNNSLRGLATKLNLSTSQFKRIINHLRTGELIKNWNIIINPNMYELFNAFRAGFNHGHLAFITHHPF